MSSWELDSAVLMRFSWRRNGGGRARELELGEDGERNCLDSTMSASGIPRRLALLTL